MRGSTAPPFMPLPSAPPPLPNIVGRATASDHDSPVSTCSGLGVGFGSGLGIGFGSGRGWSPNPKHGSPGWGGGGVHLEERVERAHEGTVVLLAVGEAWLGLRLGLGEGEG